MTHQRMQHASCGSMLVLAIGMGVAFAQQPATPPVQRGRGEPAAQDPRVRMMQGPGAPMDVMNPASRAPAGVQGNMRVMPDVNQSRAQGMVSDVDPANCTACHDRPAIPIGSHDDPASGFDGPTLSRRSWAAWWEVNREPFLRKARAQRETPIQPLAASSQIASALMNATQSASPEVRGEAILALGRIRSAAALETMKRLTRDTDQRCALRAWAAIGLLDSEDSREFLATPPAEGVDRVGWTLAVGLLSQPADPMWDTLRQQAKDPKSSPEAQRLAVWALRTHHPQGTHELLLDVINTSKSRESVTEAFVGLPAKPNPTDIKFLGDVVAGKGRTTDLPSLSQFNVDPARITTLGEGYYNVEGEIPDPFESDGERLARRTVDTPRTGAGAAAAAAAARRTAPGLVEARGTYLYLREAAVRALGEYDVLDPDTRKAIGTPAFAGVQGVRRIFLPQDVLTVGEVGVLEDYYPLSDRVEVNLLWHPGFPEPAPVDRMKRPGRGNAAIAIGLLLDRLGGGPQTVPDLVFAQAELPVRTISRFMPTPPVRGTPGPAGTVGRVGTNSARPARPNIPANSVVVPRSDAFMVQRTAPDLQLLTHLVKTDEPSELRAACAMALGIGGQKQRAAELKAVVDSLTPKDAPVFGYSMLALSLWGDPDVLRYSTRQLGPPKQTLDAKSLMSLHSSGRVTPMPLGQVLARRAAAQAMAVMGDPVAIPLLINQWGHNPAVDLELARAIAWCHRDSLSSSGTNVSLAVNFGETLTTLLASDTPPALAASAAASLGALFDKGSAQRLDSIINGQTFLTRGREAGADGKMDLKKALQQQVLALGNPHYYLTAFGTGGR